MDPRPECKVSAHSSCVLTVLLVITSLPWLGVLQLRRNRAKRKPGGVGREARRRVDWAGDVLARAKTEHKSFYYKPC